MADLAHLKSVRAGHKGVLTKKLTEVEDALKATPLDKDALEQYKVSLEDKSKVLKDLSDQVVSKLQDGTEIATEIEGQEAIVDSIRLALSKINKVLGPSSSTATGHIATSTPSNRMKLPKLSIAAFDGTYTKWMTFWDSYSSAVHDNPELSDISKFTYLQSLLQKEAKDAINGLSLTAANYQSAIDILKRRFGDVAQITAKHMEVLMSLESVTNNDNLAALRHLYDTVEVHIRGLQSLGVAPEAYGALLTPVLLKRLPSELRVVISRELTGSQWELGPILKAFSKELEARERAGMSLQASNACTRPRKSVGGSATTLVIGEKGSQSCCYCQGLHPHSSCSEVSKVGDRQKILKRQGRCFNCLKKGHLARDCRSGSKCTHCKGRHHASICVRGFGGSDSKKPQTNDPGLDPGVQPFTPASHTSSASLYSGTNQSVLLQTAIATVFNPEDPTVQIKVRVILDCGSQLSYITNRVKEALAVVPKSCRDVSIHTFGSARERTQSCEIVNVGINTKEGPPLLFKLLTVPLICSQVSAVPIEFCQRTYNYLNSLELADTPVGGEAELLVGSDYYWTVVTGETVRGGVDGPVALRTRLGWVLSGRIASDELHMESTNLVTHVLRVDTGPGMRELDRTLQSFWELESLGIIDSEESVCEQFSSNISFQQGRYEVSLPWKDPVASLSNNLRLSQRRLDSLLKRLRKEPEILKEYDSVIQQQESLGIIELVENPDEVPSGRVHYLPHHAVLKRDRETTKLRVVYDASAKDKGPSLNECLYTGPKFHQHIFDLLLRFRLHKIALTADVEKAFLMISIKEADRDVLRFLWVTSIDEDQPSLQVYRFTRVTFGVSASPFLLNATIRHHLDTHSHSYPELTQRLSRSFYVDDVVSGADCEEDAFLLYANSKMLMKKGGFNLCKFSTNHSPLRERIEKAEESFIKDSSHKETYAQSTLGQPKSIHTREKRVLGVSWDTNKDELLFEFSYLFDATNCAEVTKRQLVSMAGRFYDPLGFIQPVVIKFKVLIQELCRAKVTWDEPLEGRLLETWQALVQSLCAVQPIRVPRCYYLSQTHTSNTYQLFGFCDASTTAYAAVVYLLLRDDLRRTTRLVACKTRVSPIRPQTIPRLELLGALLLARLLTSVTSSLSTELCLGPPVCYSDSQIVLFWIKGVTKEWKPFIHNRVKEIRELVPVDCWHHCYGKTNPADIPTRGLTPVELNHCDLWWLGPPWMGTEPGKDISLENVPDECFSELKATQQSIELVVTESVGVSKIIELSNYSKLSKVLNVTALLLIFVDCLRRKLESPCQVNLSYLTKAEGLWILDVQRELVAQGNFSVLKRQLDLFRDELGIWRCGGRLDKADLPYFTKHPIVLPRSHYYTLLVVQRAHYRVFHGGVKETLTELRSKYWVTKGRMVVRQVIHSCVVCRRFDGLPYRAPPPPPLPSFRVSEQPPFTYTGVDYAGPVFVKPDHPVNAPCEQKVWICLYTCCITRAVYIDIVTNLSCHSFLRSFNRFTARRGLPHKMVSDNGSTFKSAARVIRKIVTNPVVSRHLSGLNIEWIHNLEKAPWWGGIFERLIGMTKRCLRKAIGRAKFTYDELLTVVTEIESILNSRPISFVSSLDIEEPLTPFHLLHGRHLSNLPDELCFQQIEEEFTTDVSPVLLNKRLRYLHITLDKFWKRWREEYLLNLRERYHYKMQRRSEPHNICVGDVVIIHDDQEVRGFWKLGRVKELIVGTDGKTRGALVQTLSGDRTSTLRRPVQKLYPLEINCEESPTESEAPNESIEDNSEPTVQFNPPVQSRPKRAAAIEARDKILASLCED